MIKVRAISYDRRVQMFWAMVGMVLLLSALYVYAVHATTRKTALREDLEGRLLTLATETSALEFSYIEKKNGVNIDVAYAAGYKDVTNPKYVSRSRVSTLSLNTQAR